MSSVLQPASGEERKQVITMVRGAAHAEAELLMPACKIQEQKSDVENESKRTV